MFDPVKEPLDQIALPVDPSGEGEALFAVGLRRDVGPSLPFSCLCPDSVAVIALVGKKNVTLAEVIGQRVGLGTIGNLAAGQAKVDGSAFRIDKRVDFAREPTTGTSHATIVCIPLFPVAACW